MPYKCSVPGCKSNYRNTNTQVNEKLTVFSFPSDPQRKQLWLNIISRPDFNPRHGPFICVKHFLDKFIIFSDKYTERDGTVIEIKRRTPKLTNDAYPSLFLPTSTSNSANECESALVTFEHTQQEPQTSKSSNELPTSKKRREKKLHGGQGECKIKKEIQPHVWMASDKITDFKLFCNEAKDYLEDRWLCEFDIDDITQERKCIRLCLMEDGMGTGFPKFPVAFTVTVSSDMHVNMCSGISGTIPDSSLSWLFGHEPVLKYWSQFVTLISQCSTGYWVDGNGFNQCVYINGLHELSVKREDIHILGPLNKAVGYYEKKLLYLESIQKGDMKARNEILQLRLKLNSIIFQRNQLIKKIRNLQTLASFDLDVLTSLVKENPKGKAELDKVYQLVTTIRSEEMCGGNDVVPVLMKGFLNLIHDDEPFGVEYPSTLYYEPSTLINPSPIVHSELRPSDNGECDPQAKERVRKDQKTKWKSRYKKNPLSETKDAGDLWNGIESFVCDICGKEFPKSHSLSLHKRRVHLKGVPIECKVCGKQFRCVARLNQHMLHHTDERNFQCSDCGKTFKWKKSFDVHCKYKHTEERPFKCLICNTAYKRMDALRLHERLNHLENGEVKTRKRGYPQFKREADNLFHCQVCDKTFAAACNLRKHSVRHSDKKRFKCPMCQKTFKWPECFARHKQTHSVETPYECLLCPKKFKMKCLLTAHKKVHARRELKLKEMNDWIQNPANVFV